ncbi:hypothetical protein MAR_004002 [Mya arenaria]|uniref:Uncharacterized protein n=1 Tax=Mya arenaria TaxID=6604 RepID=A0ABY7EVB5_MYAAR|nr:uncharacterized protein LOC128245457 [Mya arenaria]WAR13897.1 hypothetical protein MAR_004002 [Mya arenaria]
MDRNKTHEKRFFCKPIQLYLKTCILLHYLSTRLATELSFTARKSKQLKDTWSEWVIKGNDVHLLECLHILKPNALKRLLNELYMCRKTLYEHIYKRTDISSDSFDEIGASIQSKWNEWLHWQRGAKDETSLTALEEELNRLQNGNSTDDERKEYSHFLECFPHYETQEDPDTEPVISLKECNGVRSDAAAAADRNDHDGIRFRPLNYMFRQITLGSWSQKLEILIEEQRGIGRLTAHKQMAEIDLRRAVQHALDEQNFPDDGLTEQLEGIQRNGILEIERIHENFKSVIEEVGRATRLRIDEETTIQLSRCTLLDTTVQCFEVKTADMRMKVNGAIDRIRHQIEMTVPVLH